MNYRHAFHAGNHADVFKHAALVFILDRLLEKPRPFTVLDTHAGIGLYDLQSEAAQKTREYEDGVAKLAGAGLRSAPAYARMIQEMNPGGLNAYPGSPEIVRRLLREQDRLIACELHPADAETLKARYRSDRRISVHQRDGYEAIRALLPPPGGRGLVFMDPPFEETDEAGQLAQAFRDGLKRWSNGIFVGWYPAKDRSVGDMLARAAEGFPKALRVEFLPYAAGESSLPGSGLIVCNTPWKLDEKLRSLCGELSRLLGRGRGTWTVEWITEPTRPY